ncbi:MAG TPA: acylphosphatase [Alphaproteobacteria bacterium]|nr:acylphosphatase [Alphaproteobacteria bacterium]HAJ46064.1 acylphosphatase [Alphaproteobacteria bacterium]
MSEERHNFRLRVHGRVQGVGYRDWAIAEATRLALRGWVRNRRDGTVEILVAGPAKIVEEFMGLCTQGPAPAQVEKIDVNRVDDGEPLPGFIRRPTL